MSMLVVLIVTTHSRKRTLTSQFSLIAMNWSTYIIVGTYEYMLHYNTSQNTIPQ